MPVNPDKLIKRQERLKSERANWESLWQDTAKVCLPRKSYITRERTPGERLPDDIYDSTAPSAAQFFAAGLHAHMTNPTAKWFGLKPQNIDLLNIKEVKIWFKAVENKIYDVLNGSNFHQQIDEVYLDLGVFGTATMYEEEDFKDIVRFHTRPIEEVFIIENERGRVETIHRAYNLTANQAVEKFGWDAVGKEIRKSIDKQDYEKMYQFLHATFERDERISGKMDNINMPVSSVFIDVKRKVTVSEGGFFEFPFFTPRFSQVSGVKYGYSPAITKLPDILMVNKMAEVIIKGSEKVIDPPLTLPHDGILLPIRTTPGGLNYRFTTDPADTIVPLKTNANIPVGLEMLDRRRAIIERAFFVDLFLMLANRPTMTATEVVERAEERLLLLGPVLGKLMDELLEPIIVRTFSILARNGLLPPMPGILAEQDFKVEYTSILARAQRIMEANGILNTLNVVNAIIDRKPDAIDKINVDKTIDEVADIYGAPPEMIRDDKEVQEIRQIRAEAEAKIAETQEIATQADIAKTGSEAAKNVTPEPQVVGKI